MITIINNIYNIYFSLKTRLDRIAMEVKRGVFYLRHLLILDVAFDFVQDPSVREYLDMKGAHLKRAFEMNMDDFSGRAQEIFHVEDNVCRYYELRETAGKLDGKIFACFLNCYKKESRQELPSLFYPAAEAHRLCLRELTLIGGKLADYVQCDFVLMLRNAIEELLPELEVLAAQEEAENKGFLRIFAEKYREEQERLKRERNTFGDRLNRPLTRKDIKTLMLLELVIIFALSFIVLFFGGNA